VRDLEEISIKRAILHLVAPNKRKDLHLSPHVFEASDESVQAFLVGHIQRGLRSGRRATFKKTEPNGNHVAGWCAQAAKGHEDTFIDRSHRLATEMNRVMSKNKVIPDAVLAIIAFRATLPKGEPAGYLALLKLDPGQGFVPQEQDDGTISIRVTKDVLPSTREGLQKCAFVTPDFTQERQLVVLDVQAGTADPRTWFLDTFLEAELGDEAELTRKFSAALYEARGKLEPNLDQEQKDRFEARRKGLFAGETADADEFVKELQLPRPLAKVVLGIVDERVGDRKITLDRPTAQRYIRRVRYKADNGVEVKGPPDAFGTTVKVAPDKNNPQYRIVTVRTRAWELV